MQSIELEVTNKRTYSHFTHTLILELDHFELLLIDNNGKTMIVIAFHSFLILIFLLLLLFHSNIARANDGIGKDLVVGFLSKACLWRPFHTEQNE